MESGNTVNDEYWGDEPQTPAGLKVGHVEPMPEKSDEPEDMYISNSSIDSPPREPRTGEQVEIPGTERKEQKESAEPSCWNAFLDLQLKVKIKVGSEWKTIALPLVAGECSRSKVVEMIDRRLFGKQVQQWIGAIVGEQERYAREEEERTKNVWWKGEVSEDGETQEKEEETKTQEEANVADNESGVGL